ncbi:MAG: DNA recombination protein RmuC [Deltaproteobacteria bacterium]|nr:DNA recombination protein RmuC [Deltaproteobacteria bacterium]
MEIIIATLLGVLILLALWNIFGAKRHETDPAISLMQQEVLSLRSQLSENFNRELAERAVNIQTINQQLSNVTSQVNSQLNSVTQQLQNATGQLGQRMDNAARVVGDVKKDLGELSRATQQVFDVGKDIASLQEILRAPKLRGGLGELFLGDLLAQILPPANFKLQYTFKNGTRVDAVIQFNQGLVPIDSKFPLENFKRLIESQTDEERKANKKRFVSDVKKHIDAIAGQYIQPDEGTFNFALMYIPAENVYYETIIKDESFGEEKGIAGYAFLKRVIPVSPNSFYAYLQTILLGLKGMEISGQAQEILSHLERLKGDFDRFLRDFEVVGSHLNNARTKYDEAGKRLEKFQDKLLSLGEVSQISDSVPEASSMLKERQQKSLL